MMKQVNMNQGPHKILAGDIIAFGGENNVSSMIKVATDSVVSHVAVVVETPEGYGFSEEDTVFMEANFTKKKVRFSTLREKFEAFSGNIWHLPLKTSLHANTTKNDNLHAFLAEQLHKPYDTIQALNSAADYLDSFPFSQNGMTYNEEDFEKVFCSELVAGALEAGNIIGSINASEITPIDICKWDIFKPEYFQLQGENAISIIGYNSVSYKESAV